MSHSCKVLVGIKNAPCVSVGDRGMRVICQWRLMQIRCLCVCVSGTEEGVLHGALQKEGVV